MLETQEVDSYRTATNHIYKRKNGASKNIIDEKLIPKGLLAITSAKA